MCQFVPITIMIYLFNANMGIINSDMNISFYIPSDGGTPRFFERIKQLSRNEFLIKASIEDKQNPLTHAVSRLDLPEDIEWAKATAKYIKGQDPYKHLVTIHPVISASTNGFRPDDPYDKPWRIGEFFGQGDEIDVISQQTGQVGEWDETLQCWIGDDPYLVDSLASDRKYQKPVINTENGYKFLRDYPNYNRQIHHTDKLRRSAWRIVCAGGYFASGFSGTLGMSDFWNIIDSKNKYSFIIKDEGAPSQLSLLYKFFNDLPFWRMQPYYLMIGHKFGQICPPMIKY